MEIHATGHAEPAYGIEVPIYRVQFWEQPAPGYAHNLDAFVLVGASSVEEALKWASDNARGRVWELLLEIEPEPVGAGLQIRRSALARLAGTNPTEHSYVVTLTD